MDIDTDDNMFQTSLIWFCDITTVGLCVICKIPQILAIHKSKSVEGLSTSSLVLELLTYAISLSYNFMKGYPLFSYLEDPFLVLQTLTVLLIVYYYNEELNVLKLGMIGGAAALFYGLAIGFPHPAILPILLTSTLPMKVVSKLLQVKEIWVKKSAGNISLVSWAINIYTCVTRIITTAIVTGDQTLLLKHILSVTLNCLVIASALYFGHQATTVQKEKEDDEDELISSNKSEKNGRKKKGKNKNKKHKSD